MSVVDLLVGANCGVSVYDTSSRSEWSQCATRRAMIGAGFAAALSVCICCILLYFGKSKLYLIACVAVCAMAAAWVAFAGIRANWEYDVFEKKLTSGMANGASRDVVIRDIRNADIASAQIAATENAANRTASANIAGLLSIASALRK